MVKMLKKLPSIFIIFTLLWPCSGIDTVTADQIDQYCLDSSGYRVISYSLPLGQEFVPSTELISGVDLKLWKNDELPERVVTIQIRVGDIYGPVVGGSNVSLVPSADTCEWQSFVFDEPLSLTMGATYVIDIISYGGRWRLCGPVGECYKPGGSYKNGNWGFSDECFRTWVPSPYEPWVDLSCNPSFGTLPFDLRMKATIGHGDYDRRRRIAGRIDVTLGDGSFFSSWRAGYTTADASRPTFIPWLLSIPALGSLVGDNVFQLVAEDVTPAPYNQPPYPPAGDTDTATCTVTGIAP